ncbi:NAD(P)H-quinone oxidoreductase chain 4 [Stutzerimonas stutzeri]
MILPWLILIPFIGGLLCWLVERFDQTLPRWIALFTMTLLFGLGLWLWSNGDYSLAPTPEAGATWALEFKHVWIERFGINLHLALDGLSLLMVLLTGLLGVLSVLCSWKDIQRHVGFFHLNLMWYLGGVVGVFLSLDLFLFFFFWEMMLVPMYFLIALWGHSSEGKRSRINAATKFFIYTQASGLIMLVAILGLVLVNYHNTGVLTFDYALLLNAELDPKIEFLLMLGFFIAFAVKFPIVPLHAWLPAAHAQAPTAGSVDLAGILLKTAAYGMIRFALPLFPEGFGGLRADRHDARPDWHLLRCSAVVRPDRHQASGCLLQHLAHGFRAYRHLLGQRAGAAGRGGVDDRPRPVGCCAVHPLWPAL